MLFWVFDFESYLCTESGSNNCVVINQAYLYPGIEALSVCLLEILFRLEDNLV